MRIWSLHPKYLDARGLVALWRETLLAKNVLEGKTKGYRSHPQLLRFKAYEMPLSAVNAYLAAVYEESQCRAYKFNKEKIDWTFKACRLQVTEGQMNYERAHLLKKLKVRDTQKYKEFLDIAILEAHPLFSVVAGEIESWEIT